MMSSAGVWDSAMSVLLITGADGVRGTRDGHGQTIAERLRSGVGGQVVELGADRAFGGGPEHGVHLGVDSFDDVPRGGGARGDRGSHLLETLLPVVQVEG